MSLVYGVNELPAVRSARPLARVVAIGGGSGLPVVLAGLRRSLPLDCRITAVVTAADDGGSSGKIAAISARAGVEPVERERQAP